MVILKAQTMRDFDARAIASGLSGTTLMGRACRGLAREFLWLTGRSGSVIFCVGPGNNGGDGLGMAMHLQEAGWHVRVRVAAERGRIRGDAAVFLQRAEAAGVPVAFFPEEQDWAVDAGDLPLVDWVVDALLGTGVGGAPRGTPAAAIRWIGALARDARVLAVDVPSGLHADTGKPISPDCCVRADVTLTLGAAKSGFAMEGANVWTGSVGVIDLGFDRQELAAHADMPWRVMFSGDAREGDLRRDPETHKGTYGHILVIGGSPGLTGAVSLCAQAALRMGAGLVTLWTPRSVAAGLDAALPEVMLGYGPEDAEGYLCEPPPNPARYDAVVMGPGLGVTDGTRAVVRAVVAACEVPLVVDADALRMLAETDRPAFASAVVVLTPHPGEMAALMGCDTATVQADRGGMCQEAAARYGAAVVLKGNRTRIAFPDGGAWLNLTGNAGMAVGGCGDVLAGMMGACLVGMTDMAADTEVAVARAVWWHGAAGDRAALRIGQRGMGPVDLLTGLINADLNP